MLNLNGLNIENIEIIQRCQDKIKEEEKYISEHEFNIETFKLRMINQIHDLYIITCEKTLSEAWKFCCNENNDNNEKNKGERKQSYDFIKYLIMNYIIDDTKCNYKRAKLIKNIICQGYEGYAYDIYFIVNNITFILEIPIVKNINIHNYKYYDGRYYLRYYKEEGSCCQDYIMASYYIEDLKEAFKKFIEEGIK